MQKEYNNLVESAKQECNRLTQECKRLRQQRDALQDQLNSEAPTPERRSFLRMM